MVSPDHNGCGTSACAHPSAVSQSLPRFTNLISFSAVSALNFEGKYACSAFFMSTTSLNFTYNNEIGFGNVGRFSADNVAEISLELMVH